MSERDFYLGIVDDRFRDKNNDLVVRIQPLYVEVVDDGIWYGLIPEEVYDIFPNRGRVTWHNPPSEAIEGTTWQFRVEKQLYDEENQKHDAFRIVSGIIPTEVIDLRYVGGEEQARKLISYDGLRLSYIPSSRVYLWVTEETWVGPVYLKLLSESSDLWVLDTQQRMQPLPTVSAIEDALVEVEIDEKRLFLAPRAKIGGRRGLVDWGEDESIMRHVLYRLQSTYDEAYKLTKSRVTQTIKDLNFNDNPIIDSRLEMQRLQRAQRIVTTLAQRQDLLQALHEDFLKVSPIAAMINAAKQSAQQEDEAHIRFELADLHNRIIAKQQELAQLNQQIAAKQLEVDNIEQEINTKKVIQASQVDVLDHTLGKRLLDVMARPEQFLADVAIIRTALHLSVSQEATSLNVSAHNGYAKAEHSYQAQHTFLWTSSPYKQLLTTLDSVRTRLREAFKAQGLSSSIAFCLHATFLAGAMPVVLGGDAFDILKTYASCITEGRLLWIPIAPTMLEPTDLLGKVDTVSRRFIPHQNLLLDLLLEAPAHPDELYMVVLDGVNRAAIDAYLMPILACYRDRWQDEGKRSLSLFHPHAIAADDPYASASQLEWPQNVLLAGTLTEGATVIAPPASLWNYATLVCPHIKEFQVSLEQRARGQTSSTDRHLSSVSMNMWRTWYGDVSKNSNASPIDLLEKLDDEGFILCAEGQKLCARLYTAAMQQRDKDTASNLLLFQSILPQALSSHQEVALRQALAPQSAASMDAAIEMVREVLM